VIQIRTRRGEARLAGSRGQATKRGPALLEIKKNTAIPVVVCAWSVCVWSCQCNDQVVGGEEKEPDTETADTGTCSSSDTDNGTATDSDTGSGTDTQTDSETEEETMPDIDWVEIPPGEFKMGSEQGETDEQPVHEVYISSFEMMRAEVTVAQYEACFEQNVCTEPDTGTYGNWGYPGHESYPLNYVDWHQAASFCDWIGGRLPSEAEWEYAARSAGQDIEYPWGDETATCDYAVMLGEQGCGCGEGWSFEACSIPAGKTGQGLCDMSGNLQEWVQDRYHLDYTGAPADGSAWEEGAMDARCLRGGGFFSEAGPLRAASRQTHPPSFRMSDTGFRCAK